jgi:arylsulfatase A-like enzyme
MGEHGWFDKRWMYEESMRTPFVMRYPGVIKPGTTIDKFAVNIDWAPTILSIAGAKVPEDMQGVSLLPLFSNNGKSTAWRNEAYYHYYEYPRPHRVAPHFGVRTERYKLICFYGEKKAWELFDLQKDPRELNNLYGNKENAKTTGELKDRLLRLIKQYRDDEALQIFEKAEAGQPSNNNNRA